MIHPDLEEEDPGVRLLMQVEDTRRVTQVALVIVDDS